MWLGAFFYFADLNEIGYPRGLYRIIFGRLAFLSGGRS